MASQSEGAVPTANDGDTFRGSGPSRYSVVVNVLSIERVGFDETGLVYVREVGTVNADGSFTLVRPPLSPGAGRPERRITFHPITVGPMKRYPDW